jgi:hypothetical protein
MMLLRASGELERRYYYLERLISAPALRSRGLGLPYMQTAWPATTSKRLRQEPDSGAPPTHRWATSAAKARRSLPSCATLVP